MYPQQPYGFQDKPYDPGFTNQPPPPPPPPYYNPTEPVPPPPYANPMVVTTTQYVVAVPQPAHREYIGLSILNVVACCLPLGLLAFFFSTKSRGALRRGDPLQAAQYSSTALWLNIAGIVIGCCGHIAWITYLIYYSTTRSSPHTYDWND